MTPTILCPDCNSPLTRTTTSPHGFTARCSQGHERTITFTAETKRTMRRANDFYPTPTWATSELINRVAISGYIFECCAGDGAIADTLQSQYGCVWRNDIDKRWSELDYA